MADLPQPTSGPCLVTLANGDLFYSGGWAYPPNNLQRTSYRYIKQENRWEQKADMSDKRNIHACGRVTNPTSGKEEVVVVHGATPSGNRVSSTEIYTVEDDTWRIGTPLPHAISGAASLPYEDSFLILGGGRAGVPCMDTIYKVERYTHRKISWCVDKLKKKLMYRARQKVFPSLPGSELCKNEHPFSWCHKYRPVTASLMTISSSPPVWSMIHR